MTLDLLLGLSASALLCLVKKELGAGEMVQLLKARLITNKELENY